MHLTEWSYSQLMETPRTVLWQLGLVADAHKEKEMYDEFLRNSARE